MKRFLLGSPRILGLRFAGLISLFALDVLEGNHGFWNTTLVLLVHLIPTGILRLILALSWRREWVGGGVFPVLGAFYLIFIWSRFHWSAYAIIARSLFPVGSLFLLNGSSGVKLHASH